MADSQQANNAEEKQQEPVPSSNEQSTEINQSQQVAQETGEASEVPAGSSEGELPEGVKERTTEQFDKLKEQLKQTREELLQVKDTVTKPLPEKKVEDEKPLYDPKTGLVDIEALEQLRRDARSAKTELDSFKRQTADQEVQSLYEAHPEMNPKAEGTFNQKLFDEAEKVWLHSQAHPDKYGGRALSQKQAADLAKKGMEPSKPADNSKAEEKTQASAEASGKPTQAVARQASEEELKQLAYGTRTGDKDSIIARMRMMRESKASK